MPLEVLCIISPKFWKKNGNFCLQIGIFICTKRFKMVFVYVILFSKKVTFWKAGMWRILYFSDTFRLKIVGSVSEKFFLLLLDHWGPNGGFSENLRKQILERKGREATSMECFFSSPQIDFESKYNWFFMKDTECKSKNTNDITLLNE